MVLMCHTYVLQQQQVCLPRAAKAHTYTAAAPILLLLSLQQAVPNLLLHHSNLQPI
jgi:hypothetical protein